MVRRPVAQALSILAFAAALALAQNAVAQSLEETLGRLGRQLTEPAQAQAAKAQAEASKAPEAARFDPLRTWLGYGWHVQGMRPMLEAGRFGEALTAFDTGMDAAGAPIRLPPRPPLPGSAGEATSNLLQSLNPLAAQAGSEAAAPPSLVDGVMPPLAEQASPFLAGVERGLLQLESGAINDARASFSEAGAAGQTTGEQVRAAQTGSRGMLRRLGGVARGAARAAAGAMGNQELAPYAPPDYERVLQLNYLALSHLLLGDPAAFSVSRRTSAQQADAFEDLNDKASRLQDEARLAFEAERAEAERRLAEVRSGDAEGAPDVDGVAAQLQQAYAVGETCRAPNLPSAYVNPLGFYLSGLVYEISSLEFPEDVDAARISYEKALQLAPRSATLRAAAADLNRATSGPGRVVHLVVGEGLAPVRQALRMQLAVGENLVPLTIPRLACTASPVARIQVRGMDGRTLGSLDPIADIEGMMLQRQKDREAITATSVLFNAVRGAMENNLAQQNVFAALAVGLKQENFDRPDTRSWSSLPARVHAGRIRVPEQVQQVQLVSLDAAGRVLSRATVPIDRTTRQNVVYGRAVASTLTLAPTPQLWVRGR